MSKNSMRSLVVISSLAAAGVLLAASPVQAQEIDGKIGADAAFVLPIGDWGDAAGIGLGVFVAGRYHIDPNLAVTGRVGYITHLTKEKDIEVLGNYYTESFKMSELPILAGVKYYFEEYEGPYLGAELGFVRGSQTYEAGDFETSESNGRFAFTLGGGYEVSNVDLRAQLFSPNFLGRKDENMYMGLMLNVGYRFLEF